MPGITKQYPRKGRWTLAALFLIFGAPVALGWIYALNPALLPDKHVNHGQLIEPPVATPMRGAWTLLIPRAEECEEECARARSVASVVRRALGPEAYGRLSGPRDCMAQEMQDVCAAVVGALGVGATLVVIDPMGNAVMRYGPELKPKGLLKDMERLLTVSKHWRIDGAR